MIVKYFFTENFTWCSSQPIFTTEMLHCSRQKADHIMLSYYTYQHTGHQKFPNRLSISWDAGEENDPLSLQGTPEYACLTIGNPVNWQYISKFPTLHYTNKFYSICSPITRNSWWYFANSSLYQEERRLTSVTASNHVSSMLYPLKYYHWMKGPKLEDMHIIPQLRRMATVLQKQGDLERATVRWRSQSAKQVVGLVSVLV